MVALIIQICMEIDLILSDPFNLLLTEQTI